MFFGALYQRSSHVSSAVKLSMLKQQKHLTSLKTKKSQSPLPYVLLVPTPLNITDFLEPSHTCKSESLLGSQYNYCYYKIQSLIKVFKRARHCSLS